MSDRPPPLPFDFPPVSFGVRVRSSGDFLTVEASLMHPTKGTGWNGDGEGLTASWTGFDGDCVYVDEPCWLFKLFGDTIEKRIERAKARVTRRAERELAKRRRLALTAGKFGP